MRASVRSRGSVSYLTELDKRMRDLDISVFGGGMARLLAESERGETFALTHEGRIIAEVRPRVAFPTELRLESVHHEEPRPSPPAEMRARRKA